MKGEPSIIVALEAACAAEVQSHFQYRQDAAVLDNMGFSALAKYLYGRADEESVHFKRYMDRLVFLEGRPALQYKPTEYHGDIQSILSGQLALERGARETYQAAADMCAEVGDAPSRDLFANIEADEEEHINWLEGELLVIQQFGIVAYAIGYRGREAS